MLAGKGEEACSLCPRLPRRRARRLLSSLKCLFLLQSSPAKEKTHRTRGAPIQGHIGTPTYDTAPLSPPIQSTPSHPTCAPHITRFMQLQHSVAIAVAVPKLGPLGLLQCLHLHPRPRLRPGPGPGLRWSLEPRRSPTAAAFLGPPSPSRSRASDPRRRRAKPPPHWRTMTGSGSRYAREY